MYFQNKYYFYPCNSRNISTSYGAIFEIDSNHIQKSEELFAILKFICTFATAIRDVAQPGRVRVWGACGRKFESCHPDIENQPFTNSKWLIYFLMEHIWNTIAKIDFNKVHS